MDWKLNYNFVFCMIYLTEAFLIFLYIVLFLFFIESQTCGLYFF